MLESSDVTSSDSTSSQYGMSSSESESEPDSGISTSYSSVVSSQSAVVVGAGVEGEVVDGEADPERLAPLPLRALHNASFGSRHTSLTTISINFLSFCECPLLVGIM